MTTANADSFAQASTPDARCADVRHLHPALGPGYGTTGWTVDVARAAFAVPGPDGYTVVVASPDGEAFELAVAGAGELKGWGSDAVFGRSAPMM
ncbi:hypothetical protein FAIPA1_50238 [Frankia sp. AiPs1]|uniref:hypothetical protein n=1 Tax=Frankia sp. AiPa1 TaxID=573492 RepID=UPI00202B5C86|nr:hypothetical protein [Frankia sp. AiPa1]MCL9762317.1 hypothetical protein [Frankia sp. AiPa1]